MPLEQKLTNHTFWEGYLQFGPKLQLTKGINLTISLQKI
jgi:hypothetical protein